MAASATTPTVVDPETKETVSRCTTVAEKGAHTFEIVGYSLKKGLAAGKSVRSGIFTVGGCDWVVRFCPTWSSRGSSSDVAFIHVELVSKNVEVCARYEVWLVNRASGALGTLWQAPSPDQLVFGGSRDSSVQSASVKMSRTALEESGYVVDDCLTIRAVVTVIKECRLSETTSTAGADLDVPPPDITAHLGKLLEERDGADVTFSVAGESFSKGLLVDLLKLLSLALLTFASSTGAVFYGIET